MRKVQFFYAEAAAVQDLSRAVRRLGPDYRDPERFHIEKSEIAAPVRMHRDVVG